VRARVLSEHPLDRVDVAVQVQQQPVSAGELDDPPHHRQVGIGAVHVELADRSVGVAGQARLEVRDHRRVAHPGADLAAGAVRAQRRHDQIGASAWSSCVPSSDELDTIARRSPALAQQGDRVLRWQRRHRVVTVVDVRVEDRQLGALRRRRRPGCEGGDHDRDAAQRPPHRVDNRGRFGASHRAGGTRAVGFAHLCGSTVAARWRAMGPRITERVARRGSSPVGRRVAFAARIASNRRYRSNEPNMTAPRSRPAGRWHRRLAVASLSLLLALPAAAEDRLRIGSKRFTESYVLAWILAQAADPVRAADVRAGPRQHRDRLRGAAHRHDRPLSGIPGHDRSRDPGQRRRVDARRDRRAARRAGARHRDPVRLQHGYALAMRERDAERLGIRTLSDLARHPTLRAGLSNEFLGRADGWPGLSRRYGLAQRPVGLDHALGYGALADGRIDLMDIYTTDSKITELGLRVLVDDLGHFPRYDAVVLYRLDVPARAPAAWARMNALAGAIDERAMIAMNARAERDGTPFEAIARDFLQGRVAAPTASRGFLDKLLAPDLGRLAAQHLGLVVASVVAACAIGVPLGIAVAARPRARAAVLAAAGVLQTVPSLAMLGAADRGDRRDRGAARGPRADALRTAADRAQHRDRPGRRARRPADGRRRARADSGATAAARRAAARDADAGRRCPDRDRDRCRDRDDRRLHRRRRIRRAHRDRPRTQRHRADARRRAAVGADGDRAGARPGSARTQAGPRRAERVVVGRGGGSTLPRANPDDRRADGLALRAGAGEHRGLGSTGNGMAEFDYDLFTIGAGSGGVRASRVAAGHGARCAVAEDYRVGGTCVIRGCVPKKLFTYAAHFAQDFEDAAGYGWTVGRPSFSWPRADRGEGPRDRATRGDLPQPAAAVGRRAASTGVPSSSMRTRSRSAAGASPRATC
jgi:osmoprotectant transport system permease protein